MASQQILYELFGMLQARLVVDAVFSVRPLPYLAIARFTANPWCSPINHGGGRLPWLIGVRILDVCGVHKPKLGGGSSASVGSSLRGAQRG
jgi:hypothetical protein